MNSGKSPIRYTWSGSRRIRSCIKVGVYAEFQWKPILRVLRKKKLVTCRESKLTVQCYVVFKIDANFGNLAQLVRYHTYAHSFNVRGSSTVSPTVLFEVLHYSLIHVFEMYSSFFDNKEMVITCRKNKRSRK